MPGGVFTEGEPFGNEATAFIKEQIMQKEVERGSALVLAARVVITQVWVAHHARLGQRVHSNDCQRARS